MRARSWIYVSLTLLRPSSRLAGGHAGYDIETFEDELEEIQVIEGLLYSLHL